VTDERGPIVCLGEAIIDLVALEPGLALGYVGSFARAAGGAPANVAVGIARLGRSAAFVGRLGDDSFGRALGEELRANGVDMAGVRFDPVAQTAIAFVAIDADGDREFLFYRDRSADTLLDPSDIDPVMIVEATALHVGTVSLSTEPSASATRHALRIAGDAGVPRSCDLNLRPLLWNDADRMIQAARELTATCEVVKASLPEAETVTGLSGPIATAERLVASGARIAIVTCAAAGAAFATRGGSGIVAGSAVSALDTTGAGDAFVAALLVEICRNGALGADSPDPADVRAAVRVANAAGALATQRRGAIPALPTRAEVDAMLRGAFAPAPIPG
jgi:fructokinase